MAFIRFVNWSALSLSSMASSRRYDLYLSLSMPSIYFYSPPQLLQ
jgi:hypothetical protein